MDKKKQSPSGKGNHQDKQSDDNTKEFLKKIRWGTGKNRQAKIWLAKYLLDNVDDWKALREPQECFKLTGTKAIHNQPHIKLIQLYDAVAMLRRLNGEGFIVNKRLDSDIKGKKAGFYYIPDKYRGLAIKAIEKELNKLNNKQG